MALNLLLYIEWNIRLVYESGYTIEITPNKQ